jgi:hypothetical protein
VEFADAVDIPSDDEDDDDAVGAEPSPDNLGGGVAGGSGASAFGVLEDLKMRRLRRCPHCATF